MAQIFAGADRRQIDQEVLEAFKALPDDFWVFAEFTISRNIDWFIAHPHPDGTLALIVIELKRTDQSLSGDMNNTWKQWSPEGWRDLVLGGPYRNYYWQAVEAANALKTWLWNNQRRYRSRQDLLPQDAFKVWPDLLILSPAGTHHQLPLQPPNNFGKLLYSLDECLRHVATWKSRQLALVPLVEEEMSRLAGALGLEQIWPPHEEREREDLLGRIRHLEERILRLEALVSAAIPAAGDEPWPDRFAPLPIAREWETLEVAPRTVPYDGLQRSLLPERSPGGGAALDLLGLDGPATPPLETVFGWIEEALLHHAQGQPIRLADLGNILKGRYDLDVRVQLGLSLTELLQQAESGGHVRVFYRDRVPYATLATADDEPLDSAPTTGDPPVRRKLGREGLMLAVRIIAAAEDVAGGRVVQTVSLLKHVRESLPLNGGPALSNSEANRLLRQEFVGMGYLKPVPVRDIDLDTGDLHVAEGYCLNRDHLAVQIMIETGTAILNPAIEVRAYSTALAEVSPAN
jgi:hypothetical protein